jgi:hypothetical protein
MSNGDTLDMELRMTKNICKVCWAALVRATYKRGKDLRVVTDHFDLVYTAEHHNWHGKYLVQLSKPLGKVHALLLKEDQPGGAFMRITKVAYLDATMKSVDTAAVTSHEVKPYWK